MGMLEDEIAEDMKESRQRKIRREKLFFNKLSALGVVFICGLLVTLMIEIGLWGTARDACLEGICKDEIFVNRGSVSCSHSAQTMSVSIDKDGEKSVFCLCNHDIDGGTK